jgi:hypothetical protein
METGRYSPMTKRYADESARFIVPVVTATIVESVFRPIEQYGTLFSRGFSGFLSHKSKFLGAKTD